MIERIYEDNVLGKITDERFARMASSFEEEQKSLMASVTADETALRKAEKEQVDLRVFLDAIRQFTEIKQLTPEIVNRLIKRIEVHNSVKIDGVKHVPVDIYFTTNGTFEIPDEKELLQIMDEIRRNPLKSA